jgi:hypothetical protein
MVIIYHKCGNYEPYSADDWVASPFGRRGDRGDAIQKNGAGQLGDDNLVMNFSRDAKARKHSMEQVKAAKLGENNKRR